MREPKSKAECALVGTVRPERLGLSEPGVNELLCLAREWASDINAEGCEEPVRVCMCLCNKQLANASRSCQVCLLARPFFHFISVCMVFLLARPGW